MNFAEYRQLEGINWSSLKALATSPLYYQYLKEHPRPDTTTFKLGRAVHCAVLEPDRFAERYVVPPGDLDLRTKRGRQWKEEHTELTVVPQDVPRIAEAVLSHGEASELLSGVQTEYTVEWVGYTGLTCKARLDAVGWSPNRVIDLKTTSNGIDRFYVDAARYMYHGQMAYYCDGAIAASVLAEEPTAYIIAVETTPPYDVGVFMLSAAELRAGRVLYRMLIDQLRSCTESGMWPGRYPAVAPLSLPDWAAGMGVDPTEEEW